MEKAKRAIKTSRKFSINCIKATIWIKIWSLGQTKEPKGSTLSSFLHFLDLRMKVFGKSTRGSLMVKQDILMEKTLWVIKLHFRRGQDLVTHSLGGILSY